jgi:CelD/BcsL family acetyltransferase involved in cellulose biosynthesis
VRTEILRAPSQWSAPAIDEDWRALCRRYGSLEVLFQSPAWLGHLDATRPPAPELVILVRDDSDAIVAVMPIRKEHVDLDFVVGARQFGRFRLPCLMVLGAEPLAPPDARVHQALLSALVGELGGDECIVMPMLSRQSPFRRAVDDWVRAHKEHFLYAPAIPGSGEVHALDLPTSFDDYAASHFNSKQRSNMKRRLKLLGKELGAVRLVRYSTPDDVAPFLAAARPVSEASWQFATVGPHFDAAEDWQRKLADLARRGVLRSYVLDAGERPVAFVLGYEYGGVYYHVKTGYDRSLAKRAPGIGLLYLLLEELGKSAPFKINFMFGDAEYKQEFGNVHQRSDELILLRRNARNLVRWSSHAAFRAGVTYARDRIRKLRPLRRTGPESAD